MGTWAEGERRDGRKAQMNERLEHQEATSENDEQRITRILQANFPPGKRQELIHSVRKIPNEKGIVVYEINTHTKDPRAGLKTHLVVRMLQERLGFKQDTDFTIGGLVGSQGFRIDVDAKALEEKIPDLKKQEPVREA